MLRADKMVRVQLSDYPIMDAKKRAEVSIAHLEYLAEWLDCIPTSLMENGEFYLSASDAPIRFDIALEELIIRLKQVQKKSAQFFNRQNRPVASDIKTAA